MKDVVLIDDSLGGTPSVNLVGCPSFKQLCHEWLHHVRHHMMVATRLDNSPQSFDDFTVLIRADVRGASENSPRSIGKLDSIMDTWLIKKKKMPAWLKN